MNKRQWLVLVIGTLVTVLVPALGTTWLRPPVAGPLVEHAPGRHAQGFTDAVVPKWAVLVSLSLAGLTAAAIYKSRTEGAI